MKTVEEIKLDSKELILTREETIHKENVDLIRFDWPNSTCNDKNVETISSFICREALHDEMNNTRH